MRKLLLWLLRDHLVTTADVQALRLEWEETLNKLQTWFARHAKREKRDLDRLLEEQQQQPQAPPVPVPEDPAVVKARLRHALAQMRGLAPGLIQQPTGTEDDG